MIDIRLRSKISPEELAQKKTKLVTDADFNILLTGPTTVREPGGKVIAIYLPGLLKGSVLEGAYGVLHSLRKNQSDNRGAASGTPRLKNREFDTRSRSAIIPSAIIGSFEATPSKAYCRLTAWSGDEWDQYASLFPLFRQIADAFKEHVPERYAVQAGYAARTAAEWIIKDTPFTTITVNNSYPTGVHTDAGDLDAGFSNLAVIRRGNYSGGIFTFPEYRVGVDMQDGDLLLMDAHQWHGNTPITCNVCGNPMPVWRQAGTMIKADETAHDLCGSERISIVCYYRTKMADCGDAEAEAERAKSQAERRAELALEGAGG